MQLHQQIEEAQGQHWSVTRFRQPVGRLERGGTRGLTVEA